MSCILPHAIERTVTIDQLETELADFNDDKKLSCNDITNQIYCKICVHHIEVQKTNVQLVGVKGGIEVVDFKNGKITARLEPVYVDSTKRTVNKRITVDYLDPSIDSSVKKRINDVVSKWQGQFELNAYSQAIESFIGYIERDMFIPFKKHTRLLNGIKFSACFPQSLLNLE